MADEPVVPFTEEERVLQQRYVDLVHAMQSGVRWKLESGRGAGTSAKDVRVGINAAMADHGALATLLIQKGVITRVEYFSALVAGMEREVRTYEEEASAASGCSVRFR